MLVDQLGPMLAKAMPGLIASFVPPKINKELQALLQKAKAHPSNCTRHAIEHPPTPPTQNCSADGSDPLEQWLQAMHVGIAEPIELVNTTGMILHVHDVACSSVSMCGASALLPGGGMSVGAAVAGLGLECTAGWALDADVGAVGLSVGGKAKVKVGGLHGGLALGLAVDSATEFPDGASIAACGAGIDTLKLDFTGGGGCSFMHEKI